MRENAPLCLYFKCREKIYRHYQVSGIALKLLDVYSGKRTRAVIINVFLFSHVPAVRFTPAWRSRRRRKWRTGGAWDPNWTGLTRLGRVQVKVTRWLKHATITHQQKRLRCCPEKEAKPLCDSLIFRRNRSC